MRPIVFGLDISDRSAELVTLVQKKGEIDVAGYARVELPPGAVAQGVVQDEEALVASLARMFDSAFGAQRGPLSAGVSLPETVVFAKTFALPAGLPADKTRAEAAGRAANVFPIAVDRAATAHAVLSREGATQDVLFAAADRDVAKAYVAALSRIGVRTLFLEPESAALARALVDAKSQEPALIADIGARVTNLAVHDRSGVRLSGTVMLGGDAFSAAVEKKMGVPLAEAERLRRENGFDLDKDGGRLATVMGRTAAELVEELRRTVAFYESRAGRKVARIVLAGGTGLTPGLADLVAEEFPGISVVVGDPLRGLSCAGLPHPEHFRKNALVYATAAGLALRAIGARASPGLDLFPAPRGPDLPLSRIKDALTGIFTPMVNRSKKPEPKKKKASREAPASVPAPEPAPPAEPAAPAPVRMQIDVAPAKPEQPKATTSPVRPPAPEPTKEAPKPPEPSVAGLMAGLDKGSMETQAAGAKTQEAKSDDGEDGKDYGLGIGDILKSEEAIDPSKTAGEDEDLTTLLDAKAASRRSIESILSRKDMTPKPMRSSAAPGGGGGGRIPKNAILAVVVILLFVVAVGGIAMFVQKNGGPGFGAMFGAKPAAAPSKAPVAKAPPAPTVPQTVNVTVLASVNPPKDSAMPTVTSRVVETDVKLSDKFPATGEGKVVASTGRSTGKATIVNDTSKSYTFVATTRLLSKDGVLFRMKTASPIPAKGSVTVDVYADQPGAGGDIGPTTFTIPGLPPALQKDIYAHSDAAMSGGAGAATKGHSVTQADIDAAKKALSDKLRGEADKNFAVIVKDGEKLLPELVTSKELATTAPKVGAAGDTFSLTLSVRFRAVLFPEKDVQPLLQKAMGGALPAGASAVDYSLGSVIYTVQAGPSDTGDAQIRAEAPIIKGN